MRKNPVSRSSSIDRHLKGGDDNAGFHSVAHCQADNTTRKQIQQNGEIQPALLLSDVRDIAGPYAIWHSNYLGGKGSLKHVLRDRLTVIGIRRHAKSPALLTAQPCSSHYSNDALATAKLADFAQVSYDRPRTIPFLTRLMKLDDVMPQLRLSCTTLAYRALAPGVETGLRHHENAAHRARPPASQMLLNECVSQRDSLAKKAVAGSTDQRNIASSVSAGVRYDKVFRGLPFSLCAMAVRSRCVN